MRRKRPENTPAIPEGMAGFLLNRNKSLYILRSYVFLALFVILGLVNSAYGLEITSANYKLSVINLLQGGGFASSANYKVSWTASGEGSGSLTKLSSSSLGATSGQLYLLSIPLAKAMKMIISDLTAKTDVFGPLIPPATWQIDSDPYFYWQINVKPATLLEGFSVSLDTHPDLTIDTADPDYQFLEDSLASGKHTFYVLPFTSGGVWEEESLLSFEIWVDTEVPDVTNIEPASGVTVSDNLIPVSSFVYDAYSGIDVFNTVLTLNSQNVSFDYDTQTQILKYTPGAPLPEGKNTFLLKAVDNVGNSMVKGWELIVDTQAPTGDLLINAGEEVTYSAYVSLNINVQDEVSGIRNIYISNDGIFDTELGHPFAYSPVISNWLLGEPDVNGLKTVYVKYDDATGNLSATYKDQITLEARTPDTRIISGPNTSTLETDAAFIYEASRDGCLFSYKLDELDWSEWQAANKANFTGLTTGNHYFYVKCAFDLNGDDKITIDEEDATPASWVWTIKAEGAPEEKEEETLFWRR